MTPTETTKRQAISALVGILCSMQMASSATSTGTEARITWFIESSITVSDALFSAICTPFITEIIASPFQSFCNTSVCLELYSSRMNMSGENAQKPKIM